PPSNNTKTRVATLRKMAALKRSGWQPSAGLGGRLQWNTHITGIVIAITLIMITGVRAP
ncbi:MAG: hypothetical protein ACI8PT_001782, partial [Gammaproteobacteria bacterium]